MARSSAKDPLDKFRWGVSIDGFTRLGFTNVSTPSITYNTETYAEGGSHLFPKKIIDSVEYSPVTLERGVTVDRSFHEWAKGPINILQAEQGANSQNVIDSYRRNITLEHRDRAGRTVKSYVLFNAIPIEYKPASDFAADGDDSFSIETLTVIYESFEVRNAEEASGESDAFTDITKRIVRSL